MSDRAIHLVPSDDAPPSSMERAKALPRTSRMFSASQFERACVASSLTNGQIAHALCVTEVFVRRLRAGMATLNILHINSLPESVHTALMSELSAARRVPR